MKYLTLEVEGQCFDLPKEVNIPTIGSTIFINNKVGIVKDINYHFTDGKLFMISIFAESLRREELINNTKSDIVRILYENSHDDSSGCLCIKHENIEKLISEIIKTK